jgi:hypothetical protein
MKSLKKDIINFLSDMTSVFLFSILLIALPIIVAMTRIVLIILKDRNKVC